MNGTTTETQSYTSTDVRRKAMDLLACREHSRLELTTKLRQRDFPEALISSELNRLEQEKLLSDERFTEAYIAMRYKAGFGPKRIQEELRQRGISKELIDTYLTESDTIWTELAVVVRAKRFGKTAAKDFSEHAKQRRFLEYRGFTYEQIEKTFRTNLSVS